MSTDSAIDRLSTLPDNVIESILLCLPIKDAVRTSILSSRWRYQWSNISQLVFDEQYFSLQKGQHQTEFDSKLVKTVDQVLLLHRGPVLSFKLSTELGSCVEIDRWILFLSRNGIKKLILDKCHGEYYKLHSCVFSCNEITFLEFCRCTLDLPNSFKGFANLTVLDLQDVSSSNSALEVLISMCPLLQKLKLIEIKGCTCLKIRAVQLADLFIRCVFDELFVENAPLLTVASIELLKSDADHQSATNGIKCNLVEVFGLPSMKKLELLGRTLQILTVGDDLQRLPTNCQLKCLTVDMNFEDMHEILNVLSCFRSLPGLRKLVIQVTSDKSEARIPIDDFWEAQEDPSCLLSSLTFTKVTSFSGMKSEMKFVEFVLANAPVLETLQIELKDNKGDLLKMLKEFVWFRRRSPKARIVFPDQLVSPN